MRNLPIPAAAALLAVTSSLLLGACGGDEGEQTVTVQQTVEQTVTEPGETGSGQEGQKAEQPEELAMQNVGPAQFQTPSGNIGCVIGGGEARCDIAERSWSPPPAPADCPVDYGQGIVLRAVGNASFVCAGDTVLGASATLEYGSVAQRGALRCTSEQSGVTCIDIRDASGFVLSRESYRLL